MPYHLAQDKQVRVLHLLLEGCSLRSATRLTGVHRTTIQNLLVRAGDKCRDLMDREMRNLTLTHLECDEQWTFVLKKQGRIPVEQRANVATIGDIYLWVALDRDTKLVPTFILGKRSADMARRFMMDIASRLQAPPNPFASDAHNYQPGGYRPTLQVSTDGFAGYAEAIDLAFGQHVRYGQIIKSYRNVEQPGRYAAPEMTGSDRRPVFGEVDPFTICTSHVERFNLSTRTFMRRFTRLSLGFSKKLENLAAATALHLAYYNFCRRHASLRVTPAMAAGVTDSLWSLEEMIERSRS